MVDIIIKYTELRGVQYSVSIEKSEICIFRTNDVEKQAAFLCGLIKM